MDVQASEPANVDILQICSTKYLRIQEIVTSNMYNILSGNSINQDQPVIATLSDSTQLLRDAHASGVEFAL